MKITRIDTLVCHARMRNWIFVKVLTDQPGRVVRPNTRPGLGIEINEVEVKKHPFEQEVLRRTFYKDGSVGDW